MYREIAVLTAIASIAACSNAAPTPVGPGVVLASKGGGSGTVVVCHKPNQSAQLLELPLSALGGHLGHGDYIARLEVDPASATLGDGIHFARITDAIAAARAVRTQRIERTSASCRITIAVAAGTFTGSFDATGAPGTEYFPLVVDVPDITVAGALQMQLDGTGRATGNGDGATTILVPDRAIVALPVPETMILAIGHPGGFTGNGTVIQGIDFQQFAGASAAGGSGVGSLRVQDLVIQGDRFDTLLITAADLRASSAQLDRNYVSGLGAACAFCLAGPGVFEGSGNRILNGGIGGIQLGAVYWDNVGFAPGAHPVAPIEAYALPARADVTATLNNNEIRGHQAKPIGFGVRVTAIGTGASEIPQSSQLSLTGNLITGNAFNVIADAGAKSGTLLKGDISLALHGNTISNGCQTNLLVSFARHQTALGLANTAYILNSQYTLTLGNDIDWATVWYSIAPGKGDTLMVNNDSIPARSPVASYDGTRVCS